MKSNMGSMDRSVRIGIALLAVVLYFTDILTGTLGIVALIVAGVFLLTSVISFCPLYAIFGITTASVKK